MKFTSGSKKGVTLLELMIAVFISSILITTAYRAYKYFTVSTSREDKKAVIQKELMTISDLLSRDIRMAGIGLPGNGIAATLSDSSSDELQIFMNPSKYSTKPVSDLSYSQTKIIVLDGTGAVVNGWVCIAAPQVDTVYREIASIKINVNGPDTINLNGVIGAGTYPSAVTDIFYCEKVIFKVENVNSKKQFIIYHNRASVPIGKDIDTFNILPKNTAGTILNNNLETTVVIETFTGGHVGNDGNRTLISEDNEINIRNFD